MLGGFTWASPRVAFMAWRRWWMNLWRGSVALVLDALLHRRGHGNYSAARM